MQIIVSIKSNKFGQRFCPDFSYKYRVYFFEITIKLIMGKTNEDIYMSRLNGNGLFSTALYGLTNTYSILAQNSKSGLTYEDLTNPSAEKLQQLGYNTTFSSYLAQNFSALDEDGDGKINASDVSNLTSKLSSQGLSYNEIVQLCSSGALGSSSLTNTVLNYFDQIDDNNDGRITSAEIQAFGIEAEVEKAKTEYGTPRTSDMTVFYGNSDSDEEATSLLDSRYPDEDDKNT